MVTACFKERATFLKCLFFVVSIIVMLLVAMAIILVNQREEPHVCKTENCIKLSSQVLRDLDRSVNPCEDFHAFACGKFAKNRRELPPPSPEEEVKSMIKEMVQPGDSRPFIMQKSFYLSCSNFGAIEMDDDETILDLFFSVGDWPLLRGIHWDGTHFEWTEVAKKTRKIGLKFDWFLDFSVYQDVNDTGLNILKIDIPPLYPLKHSDIFHRQRLLTKIAVTLGAPEKLAHYETGTTIDFENNLGTLAEEHRIRQKQLDSTSLPKVRIDEVQAMWPNIRWLELINNITGLSMIGSDYIIFDQVLDYVKDLNRLIYGVPKRIVADYMLWKILEETWQYLSQPVREKFEEFYEKQYNILPELDRQKFCVEESRIQFPLIAESEYIRRHATQEKRELVKEMLFTIRNKFIEMVQRATYISKEARHRALYRLENLQFRVGGPQQVFDEFGFAEDLGLYRFAFRSSNVIDMLTQRKARFYDNYFRAINRPVSNNTARYYEKVVNISRFMVINTNTLVIPAAVLRDVFYNPQLPDYYNYATLGKRMAREIFELIFERNNRTIIDEDNDNYASYWTSDVFESAVKCLIKESSHMHNAELRRPKKMRQLLADFVAPEIAYEAYKEWALMHPHKERLPALEFRPDELFWIHSSQLSCNKMSSKHERDYSRFKIIAPLRNSHGFAADFNCTESSKMFSRKPCRIL